MATAASLPLSRVMFAIFGRGRPSAKTSLFAGPRVQVAARKRKLARLVYKGARTSVVEKMLSKLGYDHGALKPKTKADQARQQTRRLSQKVAAKVAADDDDEL